MFLPRLSEIAAQPRQVSAFRGIDRRLASPDAFFETENMSSSAYPALAPRERRRSVAALCAPHGIIAGDKLCYADGTGLYYDGALAGTLSDGEKQLAVMGAYVLVWPDKKCYNTVSGELYALENRVTTAGRTEFSLCDENGSDYTYTAAAAAPGSPEDGDMWLDTSALPNTLKRYSGFSSAWTAVPSAYIRIASTGIGAGFAAGDGARISGAAHADFNGTFRLHSVSDDELIITGTLDMAFYQTDPLTVSREVPELDFIVQNDNRLWGCSSAKREIYACKLGDPKNWNCFAGLSTDSYALSVGSPGAFTGCAAYAGSVLFFKENAILKLMGTKPANYQLLTTPARGVEPGAEKTLALADALLFYKARDGVCAYGGAQPELVSEALAGGFSGVSAGALNGKYYICMQKDGAYSLYVYDVARGLWHREDAAQALGFAALGGALYFIDGRDNTLWAVNGTGTIEPEFEWSAETGPLTAGDGHSYIRRLVLRLDADAGAEVRAALSYDGGPFEEWFRAYAATRESYTLPLLPRRADSVRVRISGRGRACLYSLTRYLEGGS